MGAELLLGPYSNGAERLKALGLLYLKNLLGDNPTSPVYLDEAESRMTKHQKGLIKPALEVLARNFIPIR